MPKFLTLVGPWVLVIWGTPLVGGLIAEHLVATYGTVGPPQSGNAAFDILFFGRYLPLLLASAIGLPTALVAWHRFVAGQNGWALPGRATLRYFWRLLMVQVFFGVAVGIATDNSADVAAAIGSQDTIAVTWALLAVIAVLAVFVGSSLALVLPAVALGRADFRGSDALRLVLPIRFSFAAGFVAALAPFTLPAGGCGWLFLHAPPDYASAAGFGFVLLAMMALASVATFLSKAYGALAKTDMTGGAA